MIHINSTYNSVSTYFSENGYERAIVCGKIALVALASLAFLSAGFYGSYLSMRMGMASTSITTQALGCLGVWSAIGGGGFGAVLSPIFASDDIVEGGSPYPMYKKTAHNIQDCALYILSSLGLALAGSVFLPAILVGIGAFAVILYPGTWLRLAVFLAEGK